MTSGPRELFYVNPVAHLPVIIHRGPTRVNQNSPRRQPFHFGRAERPPVAHDNVRMNRNWLRSAQVTIPLRWERRALIGAHSGAGILPVLLSILRMVRRDTLRWDKTSCHRLAANQARLLTGVLAYNLLHMIRQFYPVGEKVKRSVEWLIKGLIKVGAKVAYHGRRWHVRVASAFALTRHYQAVFG